MTVEWARMPSPVNDAATVVDLYARLRGDEVERLTAAFARARSRPSPDPGADKDRIGRAYARALELAKLRQDRDRAFGSALFGDHGWDLLLTLFVFRTEGRPAPAEVICGIILAPVTTAVRHLAMLIADGWVVRETGSNRTEHIYVELSDAAFERMVELLDKEPG